MSGTAGAAPPTAVLGLGLDLSGPWHQRAVQRSRVLVQTYLLTSSVHPPPAAAGAGAGAGGAGGGGGGGGRGSGSGSPLRLPSLVAPTKGPRRRGSMARLSLSEPSLLTPNNHVLFKGFSGSRRPSVLQKRPPPPPPPFSNSSVLLPCHPSRTNQQAQSCSRPAFIHFAQAIQPSCKPRPARRHSHNPVLTTEVTQGDPRPFLTRHPNSLPQGEPLSIVGRPCLPSCSERPAVAGPARAQLHVFLPTEADGEELDSESVDEGFMDELDCKITSLKLQQRAPKTATYH